MWTTSKTLRGATRTDTRTTPPKMDSASEQAENSSKLGGSNRDFYARNLQSTAGYTALALDRFAKFWKDQRFVRAPGVRGSFAGGEGVKSLISKRSIVIAGHKT